MWAAVRRFGRHARSFAASTSSSPIEQRREELRQAPRERTHGRRLVVVGVVDERILAVDEAIGDVEEHLIAVGLQEVIGDAEHPFGRWRLVKERAFLDAKVAAKQGEAPRAPQDLLVGVGQGDAERSFELLELEVRGRRTDGLEAVCGPVAELRRDLWERSVQSPEKRFETIRSVRHDAKDRSHVPRVGARRRRFFEFTSVLHGTRMRDAARCQGRATCASGRRAPHAHSLRPHRPDLAGRTAWHG